MAMPMTHSKRKKSSFTSLHLLWPAEISLNLHAHIEKLISMS